MAFLPKKQNFKNKFSRNLLRYTTKSKQTIINFGKQSIVAKNAAKIKAQSLDSIQRRLKYKLRKKAKIWFSIFPHISVTKKPQGHRMGKGKGRQKYWFALAKSGNSIVEVTGQNSNFIKNSLIASKNKISTKTYHLFKKADQLN